MKIYILSHLGDYDEGDTIIGVFSEPEKMMSYLKPIVLNKDGSASARQKPGHNATCCDAEILELDNPDAESAQFDLWAVSEKIPRD